MKKNFLFNVFAVLMSSLLLFHGTAQASLEQQVQYYDHAFQIKSVYQKLVDYGGHYRGPSDHNLTGVKNVKMALKGVLYWGGGLNTGRDNRNPLTPAALESLCEEGFTNGIYLYDTGFNSSLEHTRCRTVQGSGNTLTYSPMKYPSANKASLKMIYDTIKGTRTGPIYMHCWNGMHASNSLAALALKQFCDYTAAEAAQFWQANSEGSNKTGGFNSVIRAVEAFELYPDLRISESEKNLICLPARAAR